MALRDRMAKGSISRLTTSILCSLLCALFLWGCASTASTARGDDILALVDGEPVTEGDLEYSLKIAHRRGHLSSAGAIEVSKYVQKLIDDRLIIEEARRIGMGQYPEIQEAVQKYILRKSVERLFNEEIASKVSVSEEDIARYFNEKYERFSLGVIKVDSEKEALGILEKLEDGGDFSEFARQYPMHHSRGETRAVDYTRGSLGALEEAVLGLAPGEFSDVIAVGDKYFIVKLLNREKPADEELDRVRGSVERALAKQREEERGEEYLEYLRERADIKIDRELLASIELDGESGEEGTWSKDQRPLAEVNGSTLTVSDFVKLAASGKAKERIVDDWINVKVVDHEALSRKYETRTDLRDMVRRYENQLLKKLYIRYMVVPRIEVSDEALEEYYMNHRERYLKPARYKIQQITVPSMDEAREIRDDLDGGTDFSWLARRRSTDHAGPKGGDIGWKNEFELPEALRSVVDDLEPGGISPAVQVDSDYRIIRLVEKTEEEAKGFEKLKGSIYRAYVKEQIEATLGAHAARLREEADIVVDEGAVRRLEEKL